MDQYQQIIGQYLRLLWGGRWWIAGATVLAFSIAVTVVSRMPDVYEAEALLMPEYARMNSGLVQSPADASIGDVLRTARNRLLSYNTLLEVVREVDPYDISERPGAKQLEEGSVRRLRSALDVVVDGRAQTITIEFRHSEGEDPARVAQETVNTLTAVFERDQRTAVLQSGRTVTEFVQKHHTDRLKALEEAERNLRQFEDEHFGELPQDRGPNLKRSRTLEKEIEDLREEQQRNRDEIERLQLDRIALEQQLARAEQEGRRPDGLVTFYRSRIAELETQIAADTFQYREDSEHIQDLRRQIKMAEEKIDEVQAEQEDLPESGTVAVYRAMLKSNRSREDRLKRDIELMEQEIDEAQREIDDAVARYETGGLLAGEYKRLQREVERAKSFFESLRGAAEQIELGTTFDQEYLKAPLSVEQAAVLPREPVGPKRLMMSSVGLIAGLLLGVGICFLRLLLSSRVRAADDLRRLMPGAVLVTLPEISSRGARVGRVSLSLVGVVALVCLFAMSAGVLAVREGFVGDLQLIRPLLDFRWPWAG